MPDDALINSVAKVNVGLRRRDRSIDFKARYDATIQFSDGDKATVKPDDDRLGDSLVDCVVRRPEGLTIEPTEGTRCILGWDGGDPSKRYIMLGADAGGAATTWKIEASTSVTFLTPETIADKDLVSEHEVGKSAGTLNAAMLGGLTLNSIDGTDAEFNLSFQVPDMVTLASGGSIALVTLGRAFASAPKATITGKGSWAAAGALGFSYDAPSEQTLLLTYNGQNPITGPTDLALTVFVRGSK